MIKYISKEIFAYQKYVAIEMWQYVKKWYETHPDTFRHPYIIKDMFCYVFFKRNNIWIDWKAKCILCEKFQDNCNGCPLKDDERVCDDYKKLSDRNFPFDMRPSACERIIEAIASLVITATG